jgi:hypothetical protein
MDIGKTVYTHFSKYRTKYHAKPVIVKFGEGPSRQTQRKDTFFS